MSIGGAKRFEEVSRQCFGAMAEEVGMRPQLILRRLDAMVKNIPDAAHWLAIEMSREWPSDVYPKIETVIARQLKTVSH